MKSKLLILVCAALFLTCCNKSGQSNNSTNSDPSSSEHENDFDKKEIKIGLEEYYDKTLGGITAELWGNFSGLPTEFQYINNINPREVPWVVSQIYETDDDTSMEYVFTHMMETYGVNTVT